MRPGIMCGLLAASFLGHGVARADDGARQHFDAGKRLRDEGDCARALVEFDRSLASERSIGALYNLGFCHEQLGHRQEAYDAYRGARELASQKRDARLREISGAIAGLLETPHIRLVLPQPLPDGLQVRVDDELVPAPTYAAETVVFTRANKYHLVVVTAPGHETRRLTVETKQVAPVELKKGEAKPEPVVTSVPPAPDPDPVPEKPGSSASRKVGIGVLAGGVVTAGIAAYLYTRHRSEIDHIDTRLTNALIDCKSEVDQNGCGDEQKAHHNANITSANRRAYIVVGGTSAVALGLLVTGTVLVATGSTRKTAWSFAPVLTAESRGAVLSGEF